VKVAVGVALRHGLFGGIWVTKTGW
jgi:hypothetical protein